MACRRGTSRPSRPVAHIHVFGPTSGIPTVTDDHDDVHDLEAGATRSAGSQGRHLFRWWVCRTWFSASLRKPHQAGRGKGGSEHGSSRTPITPAGPGSARRAGCSQPSRWESVRAAMTTALTCSEESPARHCTDQAFIDDGGGCSAPACGPHTPALIRRSRVEGPGTAVTEGPLTRRGSRYPEGGLRHARVRGYASGSAAEGPRARVPGLLRRRGTGSGRSRSRSPAARSGPRPGRRRIRRSSCDARPRTRAPSAERPRRGGRAQPDLPAPRPRTGPAPRRVGGSRPPPRRARGTALHG